MTLEPGIARMATLVGLVNGKDCGRMIHSPLRTRPVSDTVMVSSTLLYGFHLSKTDLGMYPFFRKALSSLTPH